MRQRIGQVGQVQQQLHQLRLRGQSHPEQGTTTFQGWTKDLAPRKGGRIHGGKKVKTRSRLAGYPAVKHAFQVTAGKHVQFTDADNQTFGHGSLNGIHHRSPMVWVGIDTDKWLPGLPQPDNGVQNQIFTPARRATD